MLRFVSLRSLNGRVGTLRFVSLRSLNGRAGISFVERAVGETKRAYVRREEPSAFAASRVRRVAAPAA